MIPAGMEAECCLCSRYFATKSELDAHEKTFAAEHATALSKGGRTDFGKSLSAPVEFADILGSNDVPTTKELGNLEVAKAAAEPLGGQIEELFGGDARWAHIAGKPVAAVSKGTANGIDPMFADLVKIGV
jgi:hypothetical protein